MRAEENEQEREADLRHVPFAYEVNRIAAPALGTRPRAISRNSVLDQLEWLIASGEQQIPKRSSPDRAGDLLNAEERDQRDKHDRAQCQESRQRAAAEVGDAGRERA